MVRRVCLAWTEDVNQVWIHCFGVHVLGIRNKWWHHPRTTIAEGHCHLVVTSSGSYSGSDFGNGVVFVKCFRPSVMVRPSGVSTSPDHRPSVDRGLALRTLGCMLRSVVSAAAANMMLVRCNSGVPISLACSPVGAATVRLAASPEPRPSGTSEARARADSGWCGQPVR